MENKKGFTLIELLVVIAIIGLLSSMAVVSLNSARAKARDAQRISDVKQLSTVIEVAASLTGSYDIFDEDDNGDDSCGEAGSLTTTCGIIEGNDFSEFKDPLPAQAIVACDGGSDTTPCGYTMMLDTNSDGYEICFWLESETSTLDSGLNRIIQNGRFSPDCTDLD